MPQVRVLLGAPLQEVGARGFEPPTSCAQGRRATRLRYAPLKAQGKYTVSGCGSSFTPCRRVPAAPGPAAAVAAHVRDVTGDSSPRLRAPPACGQAFPPAGRWGRT